MRRYDIVSGILLILSIIDFALAAPVLVQERRQAGVDVVHIPKDVITMGKRGDEELEKLAEEFLKTWGKPIESSDAHASSSSALPGPDHGSTNVVQSAGPKLASSTANPDPLMEPSTPSSTALLPDSYDHFNSPAWDDTGSNKGYYGSGEEQPMYTPLSSEYDSDNEWHAPKLNSKPNPGPFPGADPNFDWHYWMSLEDHPPPRPASPKEVGQTSQSEHVQQPNPGQSTGADQDFNWDYWMSSKGPLAPPRPASPKEVGQTSQPQEHVQQPNPGPSPGADPNFDWDYWMSLDDPLPAPRPASPKEVGQASQHQEHVQQPNLGQSNPQSNPNLPTEPDSDPNSMAAHQPSPPLSPSGFDRDPPPFPLSPPNFYKEDHLNPPSLTGNPPSPTEAYSYTYPGLAHLPSPDARLPTVPENEVVTPTSPDLGSPIEPENEVIPGPPPTPDPEVLLDPQTSSADMPRVGYRPVDLQAAIYGAKGKGKGLESRRVSGTARDVVNAAVQ